MSAVEDEVDLPGAKAALRLAGSLQAAVDRLGAGPREAKGALDCFDSLITEVGLRHVVERLYRNGHFAQAVEEAYKYLNNLVKQRSGSGADGSGLMKTAFSVNAPILRLNALRTQSQKDQQLGYMEILSGCMTGVRNPRAHEHQYLDDPAVALELIVMANHLVRMVGASTRVRRRRATRSARAGPPTTASP